jgi:hypothetical protein
MGQQGAAATEGNGMNQATQPVRGRASVLTAVAIAVVAFASLALASLASAAENPVAAGGKTTITLNSGLLKKLKKSKAKVSGVSPATVSGGKTVVLPIEAGKLSPEGAGELEHEGGIKIKAGKKSVSVTKLILTTSSSSITAKVGAKTMKFATISGATASRNGFGTNVSVSSLKLTSAAAKELNKKLGLPIKAKKKKGKKKAVKAVPAPFKANQVLGGSATETQPKTIGITGGSSTLAVDLGSAIKLGSINVELLPVPPTTVISEIPPIVQFPMGSGGSISPDGKQGSVRTSGGLLLKQEPEHIPGETKMTLGNIWIELSTGRATVEVSVESTVETGPNEKPANLGNLGRASIGALNMTEATIKTDPATHTVTVENGKASLEETTATVLNSVFGKFEGQEPFKAGDPLGVFNFTATTE